jgi:hypothetical protein
VDFISVDVEDNSLSDGMFLLYIVILFTFLIVN